MDISIFGYPYLLAGVQLRYWAALGLMLLSGSEVVGRKDMAVLQIVSFWKTFLDLEMLAVLSAI